MHDQLIAGAEWLNADPYLWRHLAGHAAAGEALDDLVKDLGFLSVADPARLLPALSRLSDPEARRIADLYRRVADRLNAAAPIERMALLHLAAHQEDLDLAQRLEPLLTPRWRCSWANWEPTASHQVFRGHRRAVGSVNSVAFAVVDGDQMIVSVGWDGTVRLWDARTGQQRGEPLLGRDTWSGVTFADFDGDTMIVSCGWSGKVQLWDARTGQPLGELLRDYGNVLSPRNPVTALVGWLRTIRARELNSVAFAQLAGAPVTAAAGADGSVWLWNLRTRQPWGKPLRGHGGLSLASREVNSVAFGELEGALVIVSGGADRTVRIWDARTGRQRGHPMRGHEGNVKSVAFAVVDREPLIASGSEDAMVRLWDARTGEPRGRLLHRAEWVRSVYAGDWVTSVAFGEIDGEPVIASAGTDDTVRLWDPRTGEPRGEPLRGHEAQVNSVAFGVVDGESVVVSGASDGTVRLWEPRSGERRRHRGHAGGLTSIAFAIIAGDPVLASGGWDRTVRLWNARTGEQRRVPLHGHESEVTSIAFGETEGMPVLASGAEDGTIRIWDPLTGQSLSQLLRVHDGVSSVALENIEGAPVIASCGRDGVRVWDALTGQAHWRAAGLNWVTSVAFGEIEAKPVIASSGFDEAVRLWDAGTGHPRGEPLRGHTGFVSSVAFGEIDGAPAIASAGGVDGTIRLWDARTGEPHGKPLRYTSGLRSVEFAEIEGAPVVAAAGADGTVVVWDRGRADPVVTVELGALVEQVLACSDGFFAVALSQGLVVLDLSLSGVSGRRSSDVTT